MPFSSFFQYTINSIYIQNEHKKKYVFHIRYFINITSLMNLKVYINLYKNKNISYEIDFKFKSSYQLSKTHY